MIKNEFPLLKSGISYLDNAATTQKPSCVINKIVSFYESSNANPHRGVYSLSVNATEELELSRKIVSDFLNASVDEIFFTKNCTEGFNYLALSLEKKFKDIQKGSNLVTTIFEHHSNFAPWLEFCKRLDFDFRVANVNKKNFEDDILDLVDEKTRIVTFTLMSNISGKVIDAESLIKDIRKKNKDCLIIVDAAQAVAHQVLDVRKIDCDFLLFSGHKVYGPLGVGVVYGKKVILDSLVPSMLGGGMISDFNNGVFSYVDVPHRFEFGSLDVASIAGLGEALKFFSSIDDKFVLEKNLKDFALSELRKIKGVKVIGHDSSLDGPVISFVVKGIHPHDLASIADSFGVCIRAGHHCAKPFLESIGLDSVSRLSISFYNDEQDILRLVDSLKKAKVIFNE